MLEKLISGSSWIFHSAGPYKDTVNLPITKFNMRANSTQREPELQKFWEKNNIYEQLLKSNPGVGISPSFMPLSFCLHSLYMSTFLLH